MSIHKKGMFTTETLGIIIAVIGLVGLVFLGVKLYNLWIEQDMKNAKAFIEDISTKAEMLSDGQSNNFVMRGVKGWVLVGYNFSDPLRPEKCFLSSCLCLCKDEPSKCQANGYCRDIDRNITVVSKFEILDYSSSSVDLGGLDNPFTKAIVSCYLMPQTSILIPFNVSKTKDFVLITTPVHDIKTHEDYKTIRTDIEKCPNYKYAFFNG